MPSCIRIVASSAAAALPSSYSLAPRVPKPPRRLSGRYTIIHHALLPHHSPRQKLSTPQHHIRKSPQLPDIRRVYFVMRCANVHVQPQSISAKSSISNHRSYCGISPRQKAVPSDSSTYADVSTTLLMMAGKDAMGKILSPLHTARKTTY